RHGDPEEHENPQEQTVHAKRLSLRPGERVARTTHVLDFRILARFELELAAQVADVGVDAAIVGYELAAQGLLGQYIARDHLSSRSHEQLEYAKFRAGQSDRPRRDVHLAHSRIEDDRPDRELLRRRAANRTAAGAA